ncbi:toxin-antitoxin system YwqK family antitoxin [Fusobacterium animalis]|uniref:toxin-antitoxin system YwqK family antitoxin n=1 Tax=Fusobacterium animalis TaxID=76859 RepID=UPI001C6DF404|nr:toxin-antitoxin system YwqK family antitoxin [Fusobacterium animalis]QYR64638.1 toxin-antitoxin system YwqK family antitoxin [Fusobacterium animalis]
MKKILLALLLIFAMLLSACGVVKYKFKDGIMYENGKEATGTFEYNAGKYKVKANFKNGLLDGVLEKYYLDGNIMVKGTYTNREIIEEKVYYENGQLMSVFSNDKNLKLYYDDGQLIMTSNRKKGETVIYHENGNPLMVIRNIESALYNENNEMLFKVKNEELIEIGATLKKLEDGSFEYIKNNKVIAKITADEESVSYLYSTGETLMKSNDDTKVVEIFFKNGNTFFKGDGNKFTFNYKDGKPLCELEGNVAKVYDSNGNNIINNFDIITNIKKVN